MRAGEAHQPPDDARHDAGRAAGQPLGGVSRYNSVLLGINRIFEQVIRADTEEALGNTCLAVALDVTGSRIGFLGQVGADGLLHDLAISETGWDQCRVVDQSGHRRPTGDFALHGLYGRVVDDGEGFFSNDLRSHPDSIGVPHGHPALSSFLGVPLVHEGETIGLLAVANREGGYSRKQQQDLEALAPAVVETLLRKQAEEQLRQSRTDLARAQEVGQIGSWRLDVRCNVLTWSEENHRIFGVPEGTPLTYETFLGIVHPDDRKAVDAQWQAGLLGEPYDIEHRIVVGGQVRWVREKAYLETDDAGGLLGGFGITQDITERKRAELDLHRAAQQRQLALDAARMGWWRYDPARGIASWDDRYREIFGVTGYQRSIDEILARLHPEDLPGVWAKVEAALDPVNPQPYAAEYRINLPDGSMRWIEAYGIAAFEGTGEDRRATSLVGTVADITKRKQAEEALRQYAERLRFLREVDEAILAARTPGEVAQAVVAHASRVLPCLRASVLHHHPDTGKLSLLADHASGETRLGEDWHGPADTAWDLALERLMQGQAYLVEDRQALPATSPQMTQIQPEGVRAQVYEPIMIHGQLAGTLSLSMCEPGPLSAEQRDVVHELALQLAVGLEHAQLYEAVQRHAGELEQLVQQRTAALEASEGRFRTIFEEAAIGIALIDPEGRLLATNPALQRLLGTSEQELAGVPALDLLVDANGDELQELLSGQPGEYTLEQRYVRKDGETGEANVTMSVLGRDPGEPLVLALVEDITERKRAQQALLESERMATMGRMAASLAHEVNNPLQAVVGCLGLAMEALEAGEDAGPFMNVALDEVKRAARMVHRMRDLGRQDEARSEPTDVGELVARVLILTRKQAQDQQVDVIWEGGDGLPSVPMMRDRIQQVFLNVVLNAIDAMPGGGELRIQAARTEGPLGVQVSFADTGVGIAPEELERTFDAFHSTKKVGLGLGLYVSRNIVEEHGGWMDVQSEVGQGATFTVWLPATSSWRGATAI